MDSCLNHELFINVYLEYSHILEKSIDSLQKEKILEFKSKKYYNYLLIEAEPLYKMINNFDTNGLCPYSITHHDLAIFKQSIIYIGKGKNGRKCSHLVEAHTLFEGKMELNKINAKFTKIVQTWKKGEGVVVLQFLSESDHFVSLCRENAMIKSAGNSLTNLINGSVYGLMKNKWTIPEIKNFGEMLLYLSLRQCIWERPNPTFPKDIKKKAKIEQDSEPKKYFFKTNYEFNGIMDYFLDF